MGGCSVANWLIFSRKHKRGRVKKCAVDEICKQNFSRIVARGKKGAEFSYTDGRNNI
jgi:hypothetical protein